MLEDTTYGMFNPDEIQEEKYISLETYKKDDQAVRTPVWFIIKDNAIIIVTRDQTGKIKRLRNNQRVKLAVCSIKGKILGPWMPGTAEILDKAKTADAVRLRGKKYGFLAKIASVFSGTKGDFVAISVKVD